MRTSGTLTVRRKGARGGWRYRQAPRTNARLHPSVQQLQIKCCWGLQPPDAAQATRSIT
eukprot:CAMPEP_0204600114 /NCGR_PEP_ID=MMETSP0661-20131031/55251_1 /ASSEMBLY_ACC=CAM_ASM_000606 /TAXON_ID=109239 /ORGANISM="Alexandrium margalefi, Strain AMGDE01CS-322" /LENGTH=58 /DNA_ID=CAMNT_0051610901 /DNA_START=97 /DNA_END=270 /DNA_ORIENTATION=-